MQKNNAIFLNQSIHLPQDMSLAMGLRDGDRVHIQKSKKGFTVCKAQIDEREQKLFRLLTCLLSPGIVIGFSMLRKNDGAAIVDWLEHARVTNLSLNPDGKALFGQKLRDRGFSLVQNTPMDVLLSGGSGLQRERLKHFHEQKGFAREGLIVTHAEYLQANLTLDRFVEHTGITPHYFVVMKGKTMSEIYQVSPESGTLHALLIADY